MKINHIRQINQLHCQCKTLRLIYDYMNQQDRAKYLHLFEITYMRGANHYYTRLLLKMHYSAGSDHLLAILADPIKKIIIVTFLLILSALPMLS